MGDGEDRPSFLKPLHTDEYSPRRPSDAVVEAVQRARGKADASSRGEEQGFWASRHGTAAGLLAVNEAAGDTFYEVPREAVDDADAAAESMGGSQVVIDVQTHYVGDRDQQTSMFLPEMYKKAKPDWFTGLDDLTGYSFAEYLRCVFVETETALAVLSSSPGVENHVQLYNSEMYATRRLFETLGGETRLLNHSVVDPIHPEALEAMGKWVEECRPKAWKVYTLGQANLDPAAYMFDTSWRDTMPGKWKDGWMLDDDGLGRAFLERVRELARVGGPTMICAHKGISGLIDTGSPRDIGPAAVAYPDLTFVAYHSGYEVSDAEEGPYTEETSDVGTNRFVKTVRENGIGHGANVYAELGSTWFLASARPREAAHVIGKLLVAVGEDNILWGTDSIWYGPTQQLLDSFRAFQIPVEMQEEFGYPALTDAMKEKILSRNAARLYGLDLDQVRRNAANDELVWVREAAEYYRAKGHPT
jgi:predicted TIM-barrel fold metal-dependent hydrolase